MESPIKPNEDNKEINIPLLSERSRLLVTDTFTEPPVVLKIEDSIIGTLGNFSASTGKAKSKKTFNISAIVASALINDKVLGYYSSFSDNKRKILYVDTEQSPFHCLKILKRVLLLAGLPLDIQPENLEFLSLRGSDPKTRILIIEHVIEITENLGLVIIDGIRDLVYDINSPSESTYFITKLMQWTDEKHIHIHVVLHLNKGDDNTRGHLGTELNNKAETVLQVTKNEFDKNISSVTAMHIRDKDFEPFAFRINENSLPEFIEDYEHQKTGNSKGFDYAEVSEQKHRDALESLFSVSPLVSYSSLIEKLQTSYAEAGHAFGINKAKKLKTFLENKRMILKEDKFYRFNPDFYY
ncbi:AAA family ATPase [Elizabethkingia anophelis]|uniref:AAA family ATPase n=1 Tax=Elizabethkingia anophelis TaxID=1117645 RepID=UPI003AFB49F3